MTGKRTTTERGYGHTHQQQRAAWAPQVAAGQVVCARCGTRIRPGQTWQLDHTDDRQGYNGPAHTLCNLRAGGKRGAEVTNSKRAQSSSTVTREW